MRPLSTSSSLAIAALSAALAATASAGPRELPELPRLPASALPAAGCTPAAIADIQLPGPVEVDEIRVIVADRSPDAGASLVTVDDGEFDRVVRVHGALSKAMKFAPALTSHEFRVSLSPSFEAHGDACVERVELLRGGDPIATVRL